MQGMDGLAKFLDMGGYAAYVWPALGLTAVVLVALLVASARGARRREAELAALEAESGRGDEG
jgi:heme exporter protein D